MHEIQCRLELPRLRWGAYMPQTSYWILVKGEGEGMEKEERETKERERELEGRKRWKGGDEREEEKWTSQKLAQGLSCRKAGSVVKYY